MSLQKVRNGYHEYINVPTAGITKHTMTTTCEVEMQKTKTKTHTDTQEKTQQIVELYIEP